MLNQLGGQVLAAKLVDFVCGCLDSAEKRRFIIEKRSGPCFALTIPLALAKLLAIGWKGQPHENNDV
ncbi:MAG: hypothetical protein WBD20_10565 [Pirellulaceae bacterium]